MQNLPHRREMYEYRRRSREEIIDRNRMDELENLAYAEREQFFTSRYGQTLGKAATKFSGLAELPTVVEEVARHRFIEEVARAMESGEVISDIHPIMAVIEATELRTDQNYIPPDIRTDISLQWLPDVDIDSEGNIMIGTPEDALD